MKENKLLSPAAIFLLGVNSIIGSGIFLLSGKIYEDAGIWSLLAILCAGLSIFVIAFAYANMSKIYSKNGGAFVYAKETFGRFPGFIVGMVTWLLGTVTLATEVSALLTAMKMILPNLNSRLIGIIIILALGIISYFGSSIIAGLDNLTSFVKIVLVLVFIFTCLWLVRGLNFSSPNLLTASSANIGGFNGFLSAYGTVFFFFTGFSFLPVNAEKMKNPAKNLPKMMSLVMLTCLAVYLIIQTITIGALGPELTKTLVPAATAFSKIVGSIGIPLFVVGICFSIFGVIVATTFNTPTILASLAQAHEDVPMFVSKNNRFGTPTWAIILTTVCGIALFLSGNYVFLSGLTVFMSFVQYLSTGLANIKKKFLLIGIGSVLFSLVLLTSFTLSVLILGLGILILLVMIYFVVKLDDDEREKWLKEHQEKSKGADVNTVKRL
ncbi:APC family permease [Lactococcus lactis]|jgi:amino acid transporter|uniref:APC family permease n=1 Tax=Lactococcus lactis TaxID=1358 RepID=A0A552Z4P1_9LACT|nr:APC family permease [Lactococcus lactis]MDT3326028.1 APC family permease [Bacillota bacterium]KST81730.1 Amino acid permease [Lactococcus lactis subsp. lactis]KST84728.1 Amino acid permease [Lactococcus lactis subsp. lactis]MBN2938115.1 APC family permease [Lactococcus lactis]MBR8678938.1 amino acid permease [Lactococcus lactis subsp. lactis]